MTNILSRPIITQRFNLLAMLALFTFAAHSTLYCEEDMTVKENNALKQKSFKATWKDMSTTDKVILVGGCVILVCVMVMGLRYDWVKHKEKQAADLNAHQANANAPRGLVSNHQANYLRIQRNCYQLFGMYSNGHHEMARTREIYDYLVQENSPTARQVMEELLASGHISDQRAAYGIV